MRTWLYVPFLRANALGHSLGPSCAQREASWQCYNIVTCQCWMTAVRLAKYSNLGTITLHAGPYIFQSPRPLPPPSFFLLHRNISHVDQKYHESNTMRAVWRLLKVASFRCRCRGGPTDTRNPSTQVKIRVRRGVHAASSKACRPTFLFFRRTLIILTHGELVSSSREPCALSILPRSESSSIVSLYTWSSFGSWRLHHV